MADQCPPDREWLEWATDRWVSMDPNDPRASELLNEIFRENGRRRLRRDPRRLTRRDVLRRRDPETLRTLIWLRNRKMLRARGVGLLSVPAKRQISDPGCMGDEQPHAYGPAVCGDCWYRWTAIWPLGADALECPKCHSTNTDREQEKV